MRKYLFILLAALLVVNFTACRKDGVYNPSKKISRLFYESSNSDGKQLSQIWSWDENLLKTITYSGGGFSNFEYDGKKLKSIRNSSGSRYDFTYDGRKIKKMEYYDSTNKLAESYEFKHDGSKIVEIISTSFSNYKSETELLNVMSFLIGETPSKFITETTKEQRAIRQAKAANIYTVKFVWDGSNVESLTYEINDGGSYYSETMTYTYDKKTNPFYNSLFHFYMSDCPQSKNNVLSYTQSSSEGDYETGSYTYEYDGKFPTKATQYIETEYYINYFEYED